MSHPHPRRNEIARRIALAFAGAIASGMPLAIPTFAAAQEAAPASPAPANAATETAPPRPEPAAAATEPQAAPATLAGVVVTAQRQPQLAQQLPISISVVTSQDIENRGISGFAELLDQMPNTMIEQSVSAQPFISIRGISSSTNNIGMESGIGVQVDDVFLGRPSAFVTQLIDIERVEVLRGSQGTLFGKNTIGGLINVVTAKPTREFASSFDATVGNYDLIQARGYVTGAVGDSMAGKLSFTASNRTGWVENRNPDAPDLMGGQFTGVRGQLSGNAGNGVTWLATADYSHDDAVENYYDIRSGAFSVFDSNGTDRSIFTNQGDFFRRTIAGLSLKVDWQARGLNFASITAVRSVDWAGFNDQDYIELPILALGRTEDQRQFSQEFRVSGNSDRLNWQGGLYFFAQNQDGVDNMTLDEAAPPAFGLPPIPGYKEMADTIVNIKTTSAAAYGSGTYRLTDALSLGAGLRYTWEKKDLTYQQTLTQSVGLIGALAAEVPQFSDSLTDRQWSGDLSLEYRLNPDVNTYFRATRGFKGGGFNTVSSPSDDPGDLSFEPETLTTYELGLKSVFAGGKLRLNAAVFWMDYTNKQEQFFNGVVQVVTNAAQARNTGAELNLTAIPGAGWLLNASAGYQDAHYTNYLDYAGNQLVDTPRVTASASVQYQQAMSNGWRWMALGSVSYIGSSYQTPANTPELTREASTLLNASAGLRSPDGTYSLLFWVKNAANSTYRVSTYPVEAFGTVYESVNAPRTFGLEFRINL